MVFFSDVFCVGDIVEYLWGRIMGDGGEKESAK